MTTGTVGPLQQTYWKSFGDYLKQQGITEFSVKPAASHHRNFGIGRTGFTLFASIHVGQKNICVGLDVPKDDFKKLYDERNEIEKSFAISSDEDLEWREGKPLEKSSHIHFYKRNVDLCDKSQWDELHCWMLKNLKRYKAVFGKRIGL